jgi:transcription factor IIIB 90 kDa subunit
MEVAANRKIRSVANVLHLSESIINSATRMYTLAVEHKFTRGRNSMSVVAVCLYVACRQKQTYSHMLIDFSDLLQVRPSPCIASPHTHSPSPR